MTSPAVTPAVIPAVTVVDYGMGNLLSVARAFEHCGAGVTVSERPEHIIEADRLVLPGVGAFRDGMKGLAERHLIDPIKRFAAAGRPLLGICLGMQMLLEESDEFGPGEGLGLIAGRVEPIARTTACGKPHKVPHIGWASLHRPDGAAPESWRDSVLGAIPEAAAVYFVHSFAAVPASAAARLAECDYNGHRLSAAVRRDQITGTQFHPEKSGDVGLRIIDRFLTL